MKFVLIFFGLIAVCIQCSLARDPLEEAFGQAFRKCVEIQKPDEETIEMFTNDTVYENREVNCLRACALTNIDFIHDAKVNYEAMENFSASRKPEVQTDINELIAKLKECKEESEVSDDECVVVGNYTKCLQPFIKKMKEADSHGRSTTVSP